MKSIYKEGVDNVREWNLDHLIYKHGNLAQQMTKYYRQAGVIAEGVQKMDSLKVAAGVGDVLVTLVGVLEFANVDTNMLAMIIDGYSDGSATMGDDEPNSLYLMHQVGVSDLFSMLQEGKADEDTLVMPLTIIVCSLLALVKVKGLVFDRLFQNSVNKLLAVKGEMNKYGMFMHQAKDHDGDVLSGIATPRTSSVQPSGMVIEVYINVGLSGKAAELFGRAGFAFLNQERVAREMAETLDALLDKYIRHSDVWQKLLFERTPEVIVTTKGDILEVSLNDDLKFILGELKKDTHDYETISGLNEGSFR